MRQAEIQVPPEPPANNYWKEHVCEIYKKPRKNLVFMREGIDPNYFVGTCSQCGERIIECLKNK